ncbi:hypothetical protein ACIBAI_19245 [Streptomyces sp. NPDC051041]|uniref:hypothetical protein n=1 Tax=Streptomyces sp. NPDC051041 TaxID=3365640 RepID=UPI00379E54DD
MTHRGRHRRRNRGRALRAALAGTALALTAAATMISASQATDVEEAAALRPLTAPAAKDRLHVTERRVPQRWLDRLASAMGRPVGVAAVLDAADRALRASPDCTAEERTALPVAPAATRAYCWDAADTAGWRPGAVTTSGDADDDGRWGGHRVILSAWTRYEGPAGRGLARVAFVDADDPERLRHASALLVVPVDGGRDYRGLASPVSGMVWYQDKLLVTAGAGDRTALYVYDLDRIQRTTVDAGTVGRVPGGWAAHGHRFVLPAVASYTLPGGRDTPRPAGISLDRSTAPDSLVVSEWVPADGDRPTRLWRYSFSSDPARAGLLATGAAGRVSAGEAYETRTTDVRGVLSYRSAWYLGRGAEARDRRGTLWRQDTDGARATRCGADETRLCWSGGAQSLSYWEETGEVWAQADGVLFATPLSSVEDALR